MIGADFPIASRAIHGGGMATRSAAGMKITETAQMLGATTRALRYYEDQGLVTPERTRAGVRTYGNAARKRLQFILTFRRLGVSVADIRDALAGEPASLGPVLRRRIAALDSERRLILQTLAALRSESGWP